MDLLNSMPYLVWLKARPSDRPGFRFDRMGHLIKFEDYLNKQSPYGWEIDYIALYQGGHNGDINNLEVLNCQVLQAKRSKCKEIALSSPKKMSFGDWFSNLLPKGNPARQLGWGAVKMETC